jgi:hypothetical protein
MKKYILLNLIGMMMFAVFLSACNSEKHQIPEDAALVVVGNVNQDVGWVEEIIRGMETIEVESTNSKGEADIYTGVTIKSLLDIAGLEPDAVNVVFVSDDGTSTNEIPLSDVLSCESCIVSFRNKGGFSIIAPGFGKDVQIKGVIKIEVK